MNCRRFNIFTLIISFSTIVSNISSTLIKTYSSFKLFVAVRWGWEIVDESKVEYLQSGENI